MPTTFDDKRFSDLWDQYAGPLAGRGREEARKVFYAGGLAAYRFLVDVLFHDDAGTDDVLERLEGLDAEFQRFIPQDHVEH